MDNVFRFVQAGSEVSGLLGRLPSRVGYQPTLASEVAALEERIASVAGASITAIEAVYVPADDFTDPAGDRHFQPPGECDRPVAQHGGGRDLSRPSIRSRHPRCSSIRWSSASSTTPPPNGCAKPWRTGGSCATSSPCSAPKKLGAQDRLAVARARRLQRFLTQPFAVTEAFTGVAGQSVTLADTIAGCRAILDGEADSCPKATCT